MLGAIAGPGGETLSDLYGIVQTARDDADKEGRVDWGKVGNRMGSFARSNACASGKFRSGGKTERWPRSGRRTSARR